MSLCNRLRSHVHCDAHDTIHMERLQDLMRLQNIGQKALSLNVFKMERCLQGNTVKATHYV